MFAVRDQRSRWLITSKLTTTKLLIAVNTLAGLSIFFFGKYPVSHNFYFYFYFY